MDATNVLNQYLEIINSGSQFKFFCAPNGVLDWFGRSILGPTKIQDFFRYEICARYEHINFEKAEECDPIECRSSHTKTKHVSKSAINHIHPTNVVSGITSLSSRAESDVDDDVEMSCSERKKTPEKINPQQSTIEDLTPPTSSIKLETNEFTSYSDEEDGADDPRAKRIKLSSSLAKFRRLSPSPVNIVKRPAVQSLMTGFSSDEDVEVDEDPNAVVAAEYSPLRYLETRGSLCAGAKYDEPLFTPTACDKEVRIKLSYRVRLSDQDIQFALVIYENADGINRTYLNLRRNLMEEFSRIANEMEDSTSADEQPAYVVNDNDEPVVATVETPTTDNIAAALEGAAFTIVPLRTPTKLTHTPPATPKRKPRLARIMPGIKRLSGNPSVPKRSAARSLRL